MANPPPSAGTEHEQQQQHQEPQQQPHHGPISSFLQGLSNLVKPATIEVLLARLGEGNVPLVQSRSCEALAKQAKESPEQLHEIKAAGGVEALEALRERTHHESVQIAALEALVALQSKSAVTPLVQLMQTDGSEHKRRDLRAWAADHLHWLLREKGSYQQLARDSGAIPAIVKMERRESIKELLHWLGPEDSHHIRHSSRDLKSSKLDIPPALTESDEAEEEGANGAQEVTAKP